MYVLLLGLLLGLGGWQAARGAARERRGQMWLGATIAGAGLALFGLMSFWGELLWFEAVGYLGRFWTILGAQAYALGLGAAVAGLLGALLSAGAGRHLRRGVAVACGLGGVIWGLGSWQEWLLFLNRADTGTVDPILARDVGFYLFTVPLLDRAFALLVYVALVALVAALFLREDDGKVRVEVPIETQRPLAIPVASLTLALVLAAGQGLGICHLLYSELGVVMGPGWTDVHVRLPSLMLMAAVLVVAGVLPLLPAFRAFMIRLARRRTPWGPPALVATLGAWSLIGSVWLLLVVALPGLVQWLVVKPNEITFETPYIAHNIEFTRRGFKLHTIEERQFSAAQAFTRASLAANRRLLSEVRLWDWRALDAVYKQFQEIRLYYEFADVDIDRYTIGDRYRQVMVAARELAQRNLPVQSQTFVNRRFKYTHGYGYTLAPVSDFTREGLPNLLVKDIPPVAAVPELAVTRPEIYYGELTDEPVVVNTREPEFDYPSGEANAYTRYAGSGGIVLDNFWRRLLFSWKLDGTLLLVSGYPTAESRVLMHRRIQDRVRRLAPFLVFDEDPYIVAVGGRLYWIMDAYTTSTYYPYSQPFDAREQIEFRSGPQPQLGARTVRRLDRRNYVRNAVKVVVDAYNGSVDFYVFEPDDPIVRAWRAAVPDLFKGREEMPEGLKAHVRYPQDFLLAQGLIFASYHMTDPAVFYNQEDVWVRATEKHYQDITPVEPYYVMWELPGSDSPEFVLILPFTPKHRQVLIGWIAALSDGDHYGRFIAYKFPKERRMLGPQQVETKIDQDSYLSGQLTLWNQQGSAVIRGNVLAIPLDDSLLYVEPIYLQAETAAYPELRLVAVMHGDDLSYAPTLDEALEGLFTEGAAPEGAASNRSGDFAAEAQAAFEAYLEALGAGRFGAAAKALEQLQRALEELNTPKGPADG